MCLAAAPFDVDRVRRTVDRAVQRHRDLLTQYPLGSGHEALRRAIARHALGIGCSLDARSIVVTNGCLESITLTLRAVTRPGDVVALESPTYFGFLEILQNLHLRALDTQPVRAVLVVATLSNPLGACMPQVERRRLAQVVAARDIAPIEDVIDNDLAERDDMRRAVEAWGASGHAMVCGSFSKAVAPGIRLGRIDAARCHAPLARLKAATSGGQTPVLELALAELLSQPGHASAYRQLRQVIAARVDQTCAPIAQHFPKGTRVTDPPGGFILWVELPPAIDAAALFDAWLAERICIAPGSMFSASGRCRHCIRLGVGGRRDDVQRRALARVGEIAAAMLARLS